MRNRVERFKKNWRNLSPARKRKAWAVGLTFVGVPIAFAVLAFAPHHSNSTQQLLLPTPPQFRPPSMDELIREDQEITSFFENYWGWMVLIAFLAGLKAMDIILGATRLVGMALAWTWNKFRERRALAQCQD